MNTNEFLIDEIIDRKAITADIKFLIDQVAEGLDAVKKMKAARMPIAIKNQDGAAFLKQIQEQAEAAVKANKTIGELAKQVKDLQDALKKAATETENQGKATKVLTLEQAKLQEQTKKANAETRLAAKESIAVTDSYGKLQAKLSQLLQSSKDLKLGSEAFAKAQTDIAALNDELKALDAERGIFNRKVGDYAGSLGPAFKVLENELKKVQGQLSTMGKEDAGFDKLAASEKLLLSLTQNLTQAFKNPTTELKAFTNAAKVLGAEFGLASEAFQDFVAEVGDKKDELGDIQNTINFQASDTKYLDGVIDAVGAVAGAYGVAEASSALLGVSTEDLQEKFAKLQAVMTLITSLTELQKAVQLDGAAAQTLLAAKTNLLSAAQRINAALFGVSATAQAAQAATTATLATATDVAAVGLAAEATANQAVAATAVEAGVAMAGEAAATEAATAATISFGTALTATGIGAIIIAVVVAVGYLVSKISEWNNESEEAAKLQLQLAEAIDAQNQAIKKNIDLIQERYKDDISNLEKDISLTEASGVSVEKLFAKRKALSDLKKKEADEKLDSKIAQAEKEYADSGLKGVAALDAAQSAYLINYRRRTKEQIGLGNALKDLIAQPTDNLSIKEQNTRENEIKTIGARIEQAGKLADIEKSSADEIDGIKNEAFAADSERQKLTVEQNTFTAAELRKITLETTRINADLAIDASNRVLSNEKSNQEELIAATERIAKEQRRIASAENADVQSDPGSTRNDKIIAAKKLSAEIVKINKDESEKIYEINQEYITRNIAAQNAANKSIVDENINLQQSLIDADTLSLEQRTKAAETLFENKKSLLDREYQETKRLAGLSGKTQDEKYAIDADYSAKLLQLTSETQKNVTGIIDSEQENQLDKQSEYYQALEALKDSYDATNTERYTNEVLALNDSLKKGEIVYTTYQRRRAQLDLDFATQTYNIQVKSLKQQLAAFEENFKEKENAQEEFQATIAMLQMQAAASENDIEKQKLAEKIASLKKELKQYSDNVAKKKQLIEDLKKAEKDQSDAGVKGQKEWGKKFAEFLDKAQADLEALVPITQNVFGAIGEFMSIKSDRQKAEIEEQNTAREKAYEEEVKRISVLNVSDAQRADMLSILEAKRVAEKQESDRKLRKIEIERAKFEKTSNIANIITSTALAVVNALKTGGPFAIALAVAVGALGAAQLARAIATPLPKYELGTDFVPRDQLAITGEKGIEKVIEPGGNTWLTPSTASLTYLKKGSKVIPHSQLMQDGFNMAFAATFQPIRPIMESGGGVGRAEFEEMNSRLESGFSSLVSAVNNKPVPVVTNTWAGLQLSILQGKNMIEKKNWYNS